MELICSYLKPLKIVDRGDDEPYASFHKHGWALSGPVNSAANCRRCHSIKVQRSDIDIEIKKYFVQDFGGEQEDDTGPSMEDRMWEQKVRASLTRDDDHIEIVLPFRDDDVRLLDNRMQALCRLENVKLKLIRNERFRRDYVAFMEMMLCEGLRRLYQ